MNVVCMFAKFPESGKVKTRLAKDIGNEKAVEVYNTLLKKLIEFHKSQSYTFIISLSSKEKTEDFKKLFPEVELIVQEGEDLGEKLKNTFIKLLKQYEKVIVIGSDCPLVNKTVINNAIDVLKNKKFVIGPAEDGGYYLIGMKKFVNLFDSISWSTGKVLKQTLEKIDDDVGLLEMFRDVDTIEDYLFYENKGIF